MLKRDLIKALEDYPDDSAIEIDVLDEKGNSLVHVHEIGEIFDPQEDKASCVLTVHQYEKEKGLFLPWMRLTIPHYIDTDKDFPNYWKDIDESRKKDIKKD